MNQDEMDDREHYLSQSFICYECGEERKKFDRSEQDSTPYKKICKYCTGELIDNCKGCSGEDCCCCDKNPNL